MILVDIKNLTPGMQVIIVDKWGQDCYQNPYGRMDKWLGQVMTIRAIHDDCVKMEEDMREWESGNGFGWDWYPNAIADIYENKNYVIDISEYM